MSAQPTPTTDADRRAVDRLTALIGTIEGLIVAVDLGHPGLVRQWALTLDLDAIEAYKACMTAADHHEGETRSA